LAHLYCTLFADNLAILNVIKIRINLRLITPGSPLFRCHFGGVLAPIVDTRQFFSSVLHKFVLYLGSPFPQLALVGHRVEQIPPTLAAGEDVEEVITTNVANGSLFVKIAFIMTSIMMAWFTT
jgi:hypothetical protein